MSVAAGSRLGHYEVVAPIGAGGMGEVYRAHDERLRRDVAIKVLPAAVREDAGRLKRFEHEARTAGGLNHPGILSVFDVGEHDGAPYLVTELLDGATLRERLRGGPLPVRKAVEYAVQIAQALAAAHDAGVVHRDLKPDNLFVTKDGRVKILDFGLAKALEAPAARDATLTADRTDSGGVLGTAGYMAPEQVRGKAVDHRADLFAFGVVLHEMIAGAAPFAEDTPVDRALATLNDDPPPLADTRKDVTPALDAIVHRCLEKSPEERFQSARDLAFALRSLASTTGSGAGSLKAQPEPSPRRGRLVLAVTSVAVVGIAGYMLGRGLAPRAPVVAPAPAPVTSKPPTFQRIAFRPGLITRARFSPDGHTIVFGARFTGDELRVYSATPGGLEPRALYDRPMTLLDVSPTGELALALGKPAFALARAPLAGGEPRILLERFEQARVRADASWDPDGNLLVMQAIDGKFRIEDPIGTVVLDGLPSMVSPRVSPDGRLIAYSTADHPNEYDRIEVVDRAGKRRVLADKLRWVSSIAWHPDGHEIWFADGQRLRAVTLDGVERTLADLPGDVTIEEVRRDGRALIIRDDSARHIVVRKPGDPTDRELTWQNGGALQSVSDDGRFLAFGEYALASKSEAYIRPTDGGPAVHLGPGQPDAMSSDGKWIVITDNQPAHELTLVPTGAGQSRKLAIAPIAEVTDIAFFHDGKRLLLTGHETGKSDRKWVLELEGSTPPQPVTPEGVKGNALGAPTPDGTRMLVVDNTGATMLAPLDGGAPTGLPKLDGQPIGWGSNGHSIWVVQRGEPSASIASYDIATHATTTRVRLDGYDLAHNIRILYAYITPDGGTYAINYLQLSSQLYLVEGLH